MHIVLSTTSGVPMYEQIKNTVRSAVHSGELEVGGRLPSLRQLAAELRVSLMTVTRAYNDLVAERLVSNEHGRGFVVLPVDRDTADRALADRIASAMAETVTAARAARLGLDDLHRRLDEEWERDAWERTEG